jgi:hypothetical protein
LHQKWSLLEELKSPVDWLILGDSSCSQGVVPSIFKAQLNQTAINLCTTGDMGALGDLWMLEEYIQRFGIPRNVVIVHTFDIWYRDFNPVRLGQVPRPWKFWELHTFGDSLMQEQGTQFNTFLERYVPLYSQNKTIGTMIRNLLAGDLKPFTPKWEMGPDGFVPAYEPKPEIVLAGEMQQIEFTAQNAFKVSYLNDQALLELVEVADEYAMNIYVLNSPVFEDLNSHPEYQSYYLAMENYLQYVASLGTDFHYIISVKTFPASKMQNPDHLIVSGAEEYTYWIINEILQVKQ